MIDTLEKSKALAIQSAGVRLFTATLNEVERAKRGMSNARGVVYWLAGRPVIARIESANAS